MQLDGSMTMTDWLAAYYRALDRRDIDRILGFYHRDAVVVGPDGGIVKGHDQLSRIIRANGARFRTTADRVLDVDNEDQGKYVQIAAALDVTYHPIAAEPYRARVDVTFHLVDGRIWLYRVAGS